MSGQTKEGEGEHIALPPLGRGNSPRIFMYGGQLTR
jgi:hypothetical protein